MQAFSPSKGLKIKSVPSISALVRIRLHPNPETRSFREIRTNNTMPNLCNL